MRAWRSLAVAGVLGLSVKAASAGFTTTTITFSDFTDGEKTALTSNYQPVPGLSITWNNVTTAAQYHYDGFDHTSNGGTNLPSLAITDSSYSYYNGQNGAPGTTFTYSMSFDQPVTIPSLWLVPANGQNDITLQGYTNAGDATPAVTVSLPFPSFPGNGWDHGNWPDPTLVDWMQVTGLSNTPIQKLDFVASGSAGSWPNNSLGVVADDITVAPVPEPAIAGLLALSAIGGLVIRRRQV